MSKHHISWENIQEWSADIAHKIAADCPDINHMTLVAVSRGGLIPAQLIAYRLNIRDIRVMKLISYDSDNKRGETKDSRPTACLTAATSISLTTSQIPAKPCVICDAVSPMPASAR